MFGSIIYYIEYLIHVKRFSLASFEGVSMDEITGKPRMVKSHIMGNKQFPNSLLWTSGTGRQPQSPEQGKRAKL